MKDNLYRLAASFLIEQDVKEERAHVRVWVGRVLVLAALLITTVYATYVYAGNLVYRDSGGNSLTLMEEPCQLGGWFLKWKKALWVWNGEAQEACWSLQPTPQGPMVMTVDSAGDNGALQPQWFTKEEGV